jgi:hypothetical protein
MVKLSRYGTIYACKTLVGEQMSGATILSIRAASPFVLDAGRQGRDEWINHWGFEQSHDDDRIWL